MTDDYDGHTPAPWEYELDDEGDRWVDAHDDDRGSTNICRVTNGTRADAALIAAAPDLLAEVNRLREVEQEWLTIWATLEELNLVAAVRQNMTEHGFVFETDGDDE